MIRWWQVVWLAVVGAYGLAFAGWVVLKVVSQPSSLRWLEEIVLLCLAAYTLPALSLYGLFAFLDWVARASRRRRVRRQPMSARA